MVEKSKKVINYSNVRWLDNKKAVKRISFLKLLGSAPNHQRSDSILKKSKLPAIFQTK